MNDFLGFTVVLQGFYYDNLKSISKDFSIPLEALRGMRKQYKNPEVFIEKLEELLSV